MNKRIFHMDLAAAAIIALFESACTGRFVDMDGLQAKPVVDLEATKSAGSDVIVVLNEQVLELQSDGTRLYWYGRSSEFYCTGTNHWALRSCVVDDCASTLVTYTEWSKPCSTPADVQDTAGRTYTELPAGYVVGDQGVFVVDGDHIYWGAQLQSCSIAGCDAEPAIADEANMTPEHVMAERLYWLNPGNPFGLQRCDPARCTDTTETLADLSDASLPKLQGLTIDSVYAYWVSDSQIRRVATDRLSAVETVTSATLNPRGLSISGNDLYWANLFFPGDIVRCATDGCPEGGPVEVVGKQTYPNWTGLIGTTLVWSNADGNGNDVQLRHCALSDCSGTVEAIGPTSMILGRWIHESTFFFGTSADNAQTTAIHRRRF